MVLRKGMLCLCVKIFAVVAVLFLGACGSADNDHVDYDLETAIYQGLIMSAYDMENGVDEWWLPQLMELELVDMSRTRNVAINARFHIQKRLSFERADRYFGGFLVEVGDRVYAGQVLAYSTGYEPSELLLARHRIAVRELNRSISESSMEYNRRVLEIEDARFGVQTAGEDEWESYAIRLAVLELEFERFLLNRGRNIELQREHIAEMEEAISDEIIIAPFDGVITLIAMVSPGSSLIAGHVLITIVDTDSLYFTPALPSMIPDAEWRVLFRYGDIIPVSLRGEVEFYVRVVNDPFVAGLPGSSVFQLSPIDRNEVYRLLYEDYEGSWWDFVRQLKFAYPTWNMIGEGIVMPFWAIGNEDGRSFVFMYQEGVMGRRFVTLAPYDLPNAQLYVISGLNVGDVVFR